MRYSFLLLVLLAALMILEPAAADPGDTAEVQLEDFDDIVTSADLGFNDFSGNMGAINKDGQPYGLMDLECSDGDSCALKFEWDFGISDDQEAFTGIFSSLFGLTDTLATFDGETVETIAFPEHSLDLDNIDGALDEPDGPRKLLDVCIELSYQAADDEDLMLRIELKDVDNQVRFARLPISGSASPQEQCWDFRATDGDQFDIHQAKVLTFIIERQNIADGVRNPDEGLIEIHRIWFTSDRGEAQPTNSQELLDLLERRTYQYFLDWTSRKPDSEGIPQDRSTFGDLLTVGGIGFALPAHVIAAERDWIEREEAAERVLNVLRVLDDPEAFGPERVGRLGHQGWQYHFLGIDGRRRLNFDFPDTPANEALKTVELSTIDTGLAMMGILVAQTYFDGGDPLEQEIRDRAQVIYDRVNWPFMLEPSSQQFYLGWKPNEQRTGPDFQIPDEAGEGAYSGTPSHPATLDFYTDEALIVTLLALGSTTHPVPTSVFCAWQRVQDEEGLIRTFPGALFTYQFARAFLDTADPGLAACPDDPDSWLENSRQATQAVIEHAEGDSFEAYGPNAWGISAAEGPDDRYRAYGAPPVALNPEPEEDGTVTYYAMLSAASFGEDLPDRAVQALVEAWQRGHWHPRFGLPDAFNDEISEAGLGAESGSGDNILRENGPWVQRALFAIDQGPMLLHLENARSGLIWDWMAQNSNIQRALERLARTMAPVDIKPEGEPNSINLSSGGVIPVAILTTPAFDAAQVNPSTTRFEGARPARWHDEDVNGDDDVDLLLHYRVQDTDLTPDSTEGCLSGQLESGTAFQGCDSVRIVPPDRRNAGER